MTIIGISLDRVKDSWSEAIRKYNLNVWPQILSSETNEKDEKENNLSYLYNCDAIPFYVLIDKEGKIVSVYAPTPGKDFEALIDMTLQK